MTPKNSGKKKKKWSERKKKERKFDEKKVSTVSNGVSVYKRLRNETSRKVGVECASRGSVQMKSSFAEQKKKAKFGRDKNIFQLTERNETYEKIPSKGKNKVHSHGTKVLEKSVIQSAARELEHKKKAKCGRDKNIFLQTS